MQKSAEMPLEVAHSIAPLVHYVDRLFWEAHPELKGRKLPGGGKDPDFEKAWKEIFVASALDAVREMAAERNRLEKEILEHA